MKRSSQLFTALGFVVTTFSAAPAQSSSSTQTLEIKLPCGGAHFPECSEIISGGAENAGIVRTLKGRIERVVDGIYRGKWVEYTQTAEGDYVDNSDDIAKPGTPGAAPGICSPVKLALHVDAHQVEAHLVEEKHRCKPDTTLFPASNPILPKENRNHLGESCGHLARIFPEGTDYSTSTLPQKNMKNPGPFYHGRETSYVMGMLAVAISDRFHHLTEEMEASQSIKVPAGSPCSGSAQVLQKAIDELLSFKEKPVPGHPGRKDDILIIMKKGCDDGQISGCPSKQYLEIAYKNIQRAFLALAMCETLEQAKKGYYDFAGSASNYPVKALKLIRDEVIKKCVQDYPGRIRKVNECYETKFLEFMASTANTTWPKATKGCGL